MAWVELRKSILSGILKPGDPLLLREQADRLGMSIMPVREAIRRLAHEGLVDQRPQRGATVATVSLETLLDIYGIRIELESLAVRRAALTITLKDYEALGRLLDGFLTALVDGDVIRGREFHRSFHLGLYKVAGSPWLDRLIPPLLDSSELYRGLSLPRRGSPQDRRAEHQAILEACWRHESEEADVLLRAHLQRTVELVRSELKTKDPVDGGSE